MQVDRYKDADGVGWEEEWLCEQPAPGITFVVLEEEWDEDFTVRIVKRIEIKS